MIKSLLSRTSALKPPLEKFLPNAATYQLDTLRRLMYVAEKTAIGKYFDFRNLRNSHRLIADFQATVPYYDYDTIYNAWWHRSLDGEDNVTWPGHVPFYALSSGTTGSPSKYIPVTKQMIRSIQKAGVKCLFSVMRHGVAPDFYTRKMMLLGGTTSLQDMGSYQVGDLSGINIGKTPFWIKLTAKPDPYIASITDWDERLEQIARHAAEWDVGSISGSPAWNRLMLQRIMEYNKVSNIHEVWPNLRVFAHGGVSFEPYRHSFDALSGRPLIYIDTYLASEGFVAFQNRPGTKSMAMALNNGLFFEFIPFTEQNFDSDGHLLGQPHALHIGEVHTGVDYALVMSTCAGAWRYLIGDTIRFTDVERAEIVITGRTKHFMSVCGEHLSVGNMSDAIRMAQEEFDAEIPEFGLAARSEGQKFVHTWYVGCSKPLDSAALLASIDKHLCQLNDDYKTERTAVLDIEIIPVPLAVFYRWLEKIGKIGGQHKFPRVLKGKQLAEWQDFLKNQSRTNLFT